MTIDKFIPIKSRVTTIQKLSKNKTKQEKRKLEQTLLKPIKLPEYTGKLPGIGPIEKRTIQIICPSLNEVELFKKYFKISEYKGNNIRNINLLIKLLEALDNGSLEYNDEKTELHFISERGEKVLL